MSIQQNQTQLINHTHLSGNDKGHVFLPLCAKPSFLAMLEQDPQLLRDNIQHCLDTTETDVLIFIADDDVMEEAIMALGTSRARAHKLTSSVALEIRKKVDDALAQLKDYPESNRIKGVVHWADIENDSNFQDRLALMQDIMNMDLDASTNKTEAELSDVAQFQHHVKSLVKNLFDQRVTKAQKAGSNISHVFIGDGFEMRPGAKYMKRYRHLERACLLELCMILGGAEYKGQTFTEMRYLTNDPQGMTYIAACLQDLRATICESQTNKQLGLLKEAASVTHGITFVKIVEEVQSCKEATNEVIAKAYNADDNVVKINHIEKVQLCKSISISSAA